MKARCSCTTRTISAGVPCRCKAKRAAPRKPRAETRVYWWASWWTRSHKWALGAFRSGYRFDGKSEEVALCAWLEAKSGSAAEAAIKGRYPDAEIRFCRLMREDENPGVLGSRFEGITPFRVLPKRRRAR